MGKKSKPATRAEGREERVAWNSAVSLGLFCVSSFKQGNKQLENRDVVLGTFSAEYVAGSWSSRNIYYLMNWREMMRGKPEDCSDAENRWLSGEKGSIHGRYDIVLITGRKEPLVSGVSDQSRQGQ